MTTGSSRRTEPNVGHDYADSMELAYDERKFTELLVHIADRLGADSAGGATKLNKVLFFAEFTHVRRCGRPISGAEYQRLPNGPAPRRLLPVRQRLLDAGDAKLVEAPFLGYRQQRLVPLRPADLSVFGAEELETIDSVLDDLAGLTARQVSDLSHDEAGWRHAADGETIEYFMAFVAREQIVTPTVRNQAFAVAERYGIETNA